MGEALPIRLLVYVCRGSCEVLPVCSPEVSYCPGPDPHTSQGLTECILSWLPNHDLASSASCGAERTGGQHAALSTLSLCRRRFCCVSCTTSSTSREALMWPRLCSSSTAAIAKGDLWVSSSTSNAAIYHNVPHIFLDVRETNWPSSPCWGR